MHDSIAIGRLDDKTKARFRVRAAHFGGSMEEEARRILSSALTASSSAPGSLAETSCLHFAAFGGLNRELPRREEDFANCGLDVVGPRDRFVQQLGLSLAARGDVDD
jgi:antitoxin FitA